MNRPKRKFLYGVPRRPKPLPWFPRILLVGLSLIGPYFGHWLAGNTGALIGMPLGMAAGLAAMLWWASYPPPGEAETEVGK